MSESNHQLFSVISDDCAVWLMCFIGGFMDAAHYIKLKRLFVVSITGNLIVAAASVYHPYVDVAARVAVLLAFVVGLIITTAIAVRLRVVKEWSMRRAAIWLKVLEIIPLLVGMSIGIVFEENIDEASSVVDWHIITVGCIIGLAMGIHTASVKNCMPYSPSTATMSTNLVAISLNFVVFMNYYLAKHKILDMHPPHSERQRHEVQEKFHFNGKKLRQSAWPLMVFFVGAIIGGIAMDTLQFWCILIPIGILFLMMCDMYYLGKKRGRTPTSRQLRDDVELQEHQYNTNNNKPHRDREDHQHDDEDEHYNKDEEECLSNVHHLDPEVKREEDVIRAVEDVVHNVERDSQFDMGAF
jgi:uncharacterized membrane protein YoaK (UPF0700 family)